MRETNLYYEIGSHIRFRAEDCIFSRENAESSDKKLESEAVPMLIVVSVVSITVQCSLLMPISDCAGFNEGAWNRCGVMVVMICC